MMKTDGSEMIELEAQVHVSSSLFTREIKAALMAQSVFDLILGDASGVRNFPYKRCCNSESECSSDSSNGEDIRQTVPNGIKTKNQLVKSTGVASEQQTDPILATVCEHLNECTVKVTHKSKVNFHLPELSHLQIGGEVLR